MTKFQLYWFTFIMSCYTIIENPHIRDTFNLFVICTLSLVLINMFRGLYNKDEKSEE